VRAMRAHYSSVMRPRLDGALVILLLGAGIYCYRIPNLEWFALFSLAASGTLLMMLVAAFGVIPHLLFRREPKYRDDYSLTFSDEGIHFQTVHIDSQLEWSLYSRALVDRSSYLLYYGSRTFSIIPMHVFQGKEQRAEFDRLLSQKVKQIVRKDDLD